MLPELIHLMKIIILVIATGLISFRCNRKRDHSQDPNLKHVLSINNCDSLERDSIYQKHRSFKWPVTKPHNITEAMILLDSAANDFYKHHIKICSEEDMYFELGLGVRNEWVRHGETEFRDLLFRKLKMSYIDASSGFILSYYKKHLNQDTTSILTELGPAYKTDSMKDVRNEIVKIEADLKRLRSD
jgi:hypothetical protein